MCLLVIFFIGGVYNLASNTRNNDCFKEKDIEEKIMQGENLHTKIKYTST